MQALPSSTTTSRVQRTPGVGADSSSAMMANGKIHGPVAVITATPSKTTTTTTTTAGTNSTSNNKGSARVSEVMELCYVNERIIALWYREDARGVLEHATSLLRAKHSDNYMVSDDVCLFFFVILFFFYQWWIGFVFFFF